MLANIPLLFLFLLAVAAIGFLVGSVGVGGVLLVPLLVTVAEVPVQVAIAAAMFSYFFAGISSTWIYSRHNNVNRDNALWLCVGALPGALLGSLLLAYLPTLVITGLVAVVVLLAGLRAVSSHRPEISLPMSEEPGLSGRRKSGIGFGVGVLSALTGAGGPLLLLPVLGYLRWPMRAALGLAQVIQIPIAVAATIGNLAVGVFDFQLAAVVAAMMVIGAALGSHAGHLLPVALLQRAVAILLLLTACWMLFTVVGNQL